MKPSGPTMNAVEDIFANAPFMADLGAALESMEPGRVVTTLPVALRHLQHHGFIHAGVQAALADHSAGAAATTMVGPDEAVLTAEYKINFLRPASGQLLRCRATVLRAGRMLTVVESEVFAVGTANEQTLAAKAMVTLAVVKKPEAAADQAPPTVGTREGYDLWSESYDGEDNPLVALEEPRVAALLGDARGLAVADIGCGTGRHSLRLAGQGAHVVGVDFSAGMLLKARDKAAGLSGEGSLRFVVHDLASPLPFAAGEFDRVLCALVLDHIAEPAALFAELARVVKPGGKLVATVMHPAMRLRGVQARFRDTAGRSVRIASAPNCIADYVNAAVRAGLSVELLEEHCVDQALAERSPRARKYLGWPLLLAMRLGA